MSEFKGTKGKWEVYKTYDEQDTPSFSITSNESIIAYCYNLQICDGEQERTKANALLISKALEMLAMLERAERTLREVYDCDTKEIEQLIKEATII